jgi:hypothetical protein
MTRRVAHRRHNTRNKEKRKRGTRECSPRGGWRNQPEDWDFRSPATSCNETRGAATDCAELKPFVRTWAQEPIFKLAVRVFPANQMGRAGIEPATLGLKVDARLFLSIESAG